MEPKQLPPRVTAALDHAATLHAGQVDKAGEPYIAHVRRVVDRVAAIAPPEVREDAMIAAALHDTVEDCGVTPEELAGHGYPATVIDAVISVTRGSDEDYDALIERAGADPIGRWVKLADNLDNSDPSRLAKLDPDTAERLEAKYAAARRTLARHGATTLGPAGS